MKRTLATALIATSLAFVMMSLSSCGFFNTLANMGQYEDINGTDTSLAILTDDEIFGEIQNYAQFGAISGNTGNGFFYTAQKFSGVYTVARFTVRDKKAFIISSTLELEEGNFRIVLLRDGSYVADIPTDGTRLELEPKDGTYTIRIAGESAKVNLEVEISYGDDFPSPLPQDPENGEVLV